MSCEDPGQFRTLVTSHCTDLRSDQCSLALVKAGGAYGPGCLDLSIVASPELGMPPYRDYVCPGATGALARLCGPPKQQVASNAGAGTSKGSSYGTLAASLGVTTTALGLTTAALYRKYTATRPMETKMATTRNTPDQTAQTAAIEGLKLQVAALNTQHEEDLSSLDETQTRNQALQEHVEQLTEVVKTKVADHREYVSRSDDANVELQRGIARLYDITPQTYDHTKDPELNQLTKFVVDTHREHDTLVARLR